MLPSTPTKSNTKNSGSVHLSCIAVLSNPRRIGNGANSLALDLHLILGHSGFPDEKTILARYFNASGLSFDPPRVCSVNFSLTSLKKDCRITVGEDVVSNETHDGLGDISSLEIICPDRSANEVLSENIVTPTLAPLVHISCVVLSSSKAEYNFTALPNPYNGFDRVSTFPVTISLNNPRWNEECKKMLTPTKGSVVKVTGTVSAVHSDENKVNHWIVTASEIYFIKESSQAAKPAVPGTVQAEKPGKAFSYSNVSPSPLKRQRTEAN